MLRAFRGPTRLPRTACCRAALRPCSLSWARCLCSCLKPAHVSLIYLTLGRHARGTQALGCLQGAVSGFLPAPQGWVTVLGRRTAWQSQRCPTIPLSGPRVAGGGAGGAILIRALLASRLRRRSCRRAGVEEGGGGLDGSGRMTECACVGRAARCPCRVLARTIKAVSHASAAA